MAYFLGLDSGGTKTECWLGDETRVLARAVCGTVKLTRVGEEIASVRMHTLLTEVSDRSGVPLKDIVRTCIGISGYSIPAVREWASRTLTEVVGGAVQVCGDEVIALDAAFRRGPGILVIAGTGSQVVGRCSDGSRFTAGGWGPGIGDEGSGFWIGKELLREAYRAVDRGEDLGTRLQDAICVAWGLTAVEEIVGYANAQPAPDFAALAPVVMSFAAAGDPLAIAILERAGEELGQQVAIVWSRMQASGETSALVAYTGSVVEKIALVSDHMRQWIETSCSRLSVMDAAVNALQGAIWRARTQGSGSGK
jgi:glucosamine kinase